MILLMNKFFNDQASFCVEKTLIYIRKKCPDYKNLRKIKNT